MFGADATLLLATATAQSGTNALTILSTTPPAGGLTTGGSALSGAYATTTLATPLGDGRSA